MRAAPGSVRFTSVGSVNRSRNRENAKVRETGVCGCCGERRKGTTKHHFAPLRDFALSRPVGGALLMMVMAAVAPLSAQVAIRGETVYTMAGAPIRNGVVIVGRDGKIQ